MRQPVGRIIPSLTVFEILVPCKLQQSLKFMQYLLLVLVLLDHYIDIYTIKLAASLYPRLPYDYKGIRVAIALSIPISDDEMAIVYHSGVG